MVTGRSGVVDRVKALRIEQFGGPEVLRLVDVDDPAPAAGETLIRTGAVGVNFGEIIIREGGASLPISLPLIPGSEAAGTVAALGRGVSDLRVGDRVAVPLFVTGRLDGGYAEFITAPAAILVPLPPAVSFEQAAAVQMQGLTALSMLDRDPPRGKTVLIHAAAGGVGSYLVQLARIRGAAQIIATAGSPTKLDVATRLGADAAIDYTEPDWTDRVAAATAGDGPDIIYDPVGGDVRKRSFEVLAPLGTLLIYGIAATRTFEPIDAAQLASMYMKCQTVTAFSLWPVINSGDELRRGLDELLAMLVNRRIEAVIGRSYPLAAAADAHRALRARETVGKVVLLP
jgi:NADPH2:quinone reductase